MIILGLDPGTAATGYAVLEVDRGQRPILMVSDVIKTSKNLDMHKRLRVLYKALTDIAKEYSPHIMVVERIFFNTNTKTAISVGQARGVSLLVAADLDMYVFEHTALEAKMALTGYGRAKKKDVQFAVKEYFNLDKIIKPDDASDAAAIALCFIEKNEDFSGIFDQIK